MVGKMITIFRPSSSERGADSINKVNNDMNIYWDGNSDRRVVRRGYSYYLLTPQYFDVPNGFIAHLMGECGGKIHHRHIAVVREADMQRK
jgi:hypothetical protein